MLPLFLPRPPVNHPAKQVNKRENGGAIKDNETLYGVFIYKGLNMLYTNYVHVRCEMRAIYDLK